MRIKQVEYIKDYKLKIVFSDKAVKVVDLANIIKENGGVFSPLKDLDYFKKVTLDDCQLSICWPNGADICPDVLYEAGKEIKKKKITSTRRRKSTVEKAKITYPAHAMAKKISKKGKV